MSNELVNKNKYLRYRWTPEHNRLENQGLFYSRIHLLTTIIAMTSGIGAIMLGITNNTVSAELIGISILAIVINVMYDLKDRARRYQSMAGALRREREMFEAQAGQYLHSNTALSRFMQRCEAIIEFKGDGFSPFFIENDNNTIISGSPEKPSSNPFSRQPDSPSRSRFGFERLGGLRSLAREDNELEADDDELETDDDKNSDEGSSRFGASSFRRATGKSPFSGSNSSSSRGSSSNPFNRSSASSSNPFGSSGTLPRGRPLVSSGGIRREDNDDPAIADLQNGNGRTGVRFAAFYPKEIAPSIWTPIKAYAFMGHAQDVITLDARDGDIRKLPEILYDRNRNVRYHIPEGAQVTVTPHIKGFQCNPQSVTIGFYRTWHRFDFEIRATDARADEATNGYLTFMIDGLVVADVPMSIYVSKSVNKDDKNAIRSTIRKPYRHVYASFSEADAHLAGRFERIYEALGIYSMRDLMQLRAKGDWNESMLKAIDDAEVFQLFWSESAAESQTVTRELEYALGRANDVKMFIRAVYWEHPPVELPANLSDLKPDYRPDIVG